MLGRASVRGFEAGVRRLVVVRGCAHVWKQQPASVSSPFDRLLCQPQEEVRSFPV